MKDKKELLLFSLVFAIFSSLTFTLEIHFVSPFFISRMGPWGGQQATYSGQPTGPNGQPSRPLFPSAAASASGASTSTGKPTFPAYGE